MERRDFLRGLGLAGAGATTGWWGARAADAAPAAVHPPAGGAQELFLPAAPVGTSGGRAGMLLVAAADAPAVVRAAAHYLCDGNSDQVEINQALADLGSVGGLVQLSEGSFSCSGPVRMRRRTTLLGRGRATRLFAVGSWSAFDGATPGALIEPLDGGVDKTTVAALALDGQRYQGADVGGIYYNIVDNAGFDEGPDAGHWFSDLYIFETRRHGLHVTGERMRASKAAGIRVYNVGQEGVTEAHGFLIACPDGFYTQCESGSSSGSGFYIDGSNNRFTNCKSWYADLSGWQIRKPRGQYSACESQDNAQHGFYITTGPNSLVGCHADSNSWESSAPAVAFDGFHIPWGNRVQLVGCSAYDKNEGGRGRWQRYGFYVGGSARHCQIIGTVADNATGAGGGSGLADASNLVMIAG